MTQYIDKDALVAEIESKIEKYTKRGEESDAKRDGYGMYWGGVLSCLNEVRTLCDSLEVKEVDLLTPEEIKKICTIYDNLNEERKCATVLYNSDETFFNHVLMEYKSIAKTT